jgi:diamine N-acetyltransferase
VINGSHIFLRKLQSTDVDVIYEWENDTENWKVSGTTKSFTKEEIETFVNSQQNLALNGQIRYVICLQDSKKPIGTIDLFEFDALQKTAGIGILIGDKSYRNKGYASEALNLIINYCRNELSLVNLFCNIQKDNTTSIRLFEKCKFQFIEERVLFENKVNYYELIK